MNKKSAVLGIAIILLCSSFVSEAYPFQYMPGSLVEDKLYASFNVIISEGFYFLVIDNTGAVSKKSIRNDAYIIYDLTFSHEELDSFSDSLTINEDDYLVISFNFNLTGIFVTEAFFEIRSSRRVSAFITDSDGLAEYFREVGRLAINIQRPIVYTISAFGAALVVSIILSSFITHKKEERDELITRTPVDKVDEPGYCRYCGKTIKSDIKICNACKRRINKMGRIQGNIG